MPFVLPVQMYRSAYIDHINIQKRSKQRMREEIRKKADLICKHSQFVIAAYTHSIDTDNTGQSPYHDADKGIDISLIALLFGPVI